MPGEGNDYSKLVANLKSRGYSTALNSIQSNLGLSAETSYAEMEALLIYEIGKVYNSELQKIDIALMALGLLNGFSNREDRLELQQERERYRERCDKFLQKTNYIATIYKGKFTYESAKQTIKTTLSGKKKTKLETIRSTLDTTTTRYLTNVVKSLYTKKNTINDRLKAAKDTFDKSAHEKGIQKINWEKLSRIPEDLLPPLKHFEYITLRIDDNGDAPTMSPQSPDADDKDTDSKAKSKKHSLSHRISKLLGFLRKGVKVPLYAIMLVILIITILVCTCLFHHPPNAGKPVTQADGTSHVYPSESFIPPPIEIEASISTDNINAQLRIQIPQN